MKTSLLLILVIPYLMLAQTDYNQMTNWYYHPNRAFNFIENYNLDIALVNRDLEVDSIIQITNNAGVNTGVDIFWVHPTHLTNPPIKPTTIPIEDQDQTYIGLAILGQGALLSKYGRFYAPKYRQASPSSFLGFGYSEQERATALLETYSDIKAAFLNYMEKYNNGNKIILAGHSQGSFLLAMLLRDLFDTNPQMKELLVTASLGGMSYVYAKPGTFSGGWWENIPLCTYTNECGCVHYWRSYEENEELPDPNTNLPSFSQILADSGLVYRITDINTDLLLQDSIFYGAESSQLRYYIAPDANYNLAPGYNIIAFDSLYSIRFKREADFKAGFALKRNGDPFDNRPNDIDSNKTNPFFSDGDLHVKDYHIYIWALMKQIDSKLEECKTTSYNINYSNSSDFIVYPIPNSGEIKIELSSNQVKRSIHSFIIMNNLGQKIKTFEMNANVETINIDTKGVYYIISNNGFGTKKIVIN